MLSEQDQIDPVYQGITKITPEWYLYKLSDDGGYNLLHIHTEEETPVDFNAVITYSSKERLELKFPLWQDENLNLNGYLYTKHKGKCHGCVECGMKAPERVERILILLRSKLNGL